MDDADHFADGTVAEVVYVGAATRYLVALDVGGELVALAQNVDTSPRPTAVVTTFTAGAGVETLPVWTFSNIARPNQAPIVMVVAAVLLVLAIIPVWLAQRLSGDTSGGRL